MNDRRPRRGPELVAIVGRGERLEQLAGVAFAPEIAAVADAKARAKQADQQLAQHLTQVPLQVAEAGQVGAVGDGKSDDGTLRSGHGVTSSSESALKSKPSPSLLASMSGRSCSSSGGSG